MYQIRKHLFPTLPAVCLLLWIGIFSVDCTRCMNLKAPLFVIPLEVTADDGGSGRYQGLGYTVNVEKHLDAELGLQVVAVEMRVMGRTVAASTS